MPPMDPASMIDQIASQQLGEAPAPAAPPPEAPEQDSPTDKAVADGAPEDASAKMDAEAILYELDMGEGRKRKLTPEQIKGTMARYSELNYKHAQYKPVLELVEQLIEANPGATPAQVAEYMVSLGRAQQSNPTMGNTKPDAPNQTDGDGEDPYAKWEKENASTLPPGYKEMLQSGKAQNDRFDRIEKMLMQVLGAGQGVADAARAGQEDARNAKVSAIQQQISNNLDRAQAALSLPDTEAENFMTFAAERGYSLEDFIDPRLTASVMQDYKNNMNSPEFERLAEISRRRQAWTGSITTPPAGGAPAEAKPTGNGMFDALAQSVLAKRGPQPL